jgi:hypothetical protein
MKFIVCGGRDYSDKARLHRVLDGVHKKCTIHAIIEGGAPGADRLAREWALEKGVQVFTAISNGDEQKQYAAMLSLEPDGVIAFHDGIQARDLTRMAELSDVKVMHILF